MSEYSQVLGDTVRAARKKMGLSQNKVAALIDADERTIMNIETYNANTTMDVLYPLIRLLRIDPRQHRLWRRCERCPECRRRTSGI